MLCAVQQGQRLLTNPLRGFTLLEVLIALSILAISSIAVMTQIGQSVRQIEQLELKTMALWIAENQITTMQITEQWPGTGRQSQALSVAHQRWVIDTQISTTANPMMRKIEVTVGINQAGQSMPMVSLVAFRGRR
jgi:general secretion pathway protein I